MTHQPELLLLHWMISTIASLVENLQHHPIVQGPIPPMSTFTNTPAYRLFLQLRNTLRHLINTAICPDLKWPPWLHMIPDVGYISGLGKGDPFSAVAWLPDHRRVRMAPLTVQSLQTRVFGRCCALRRVLALGCGEFGAQSF